MMNLTRRQFGKRATLTAIGLRIAWASGLAGIALTQEGCNVFNDILNWVPVGEAAVNAMLSVLTSNGFPIPAPVQEYVNLTEAAFTALTAAVKEYQATTPPPAGAVAKVELALKTVVDNFTLFLRSINVPGNIFSVIAGLAQVVLSTIAAFENQLPQPAAGKRQLVAATFSVGQTSVAVVPKSRSRRAFKRDWNGQLDAGARLGVAVPKSAYLPLTFFEHL
jgi:hypothetical protein